MQLDGVTFKWKDNDEPSVGLIAQDVEKVFPELVTTNPTTNLKSLGYSNLVAPIIEAIKELAKKVEDIVVSIGQIKDEIIFHERQIGDLQTKIDDQQKAIKVLQSEIQAVNRK